MAGPLKKPEQFRRGRQFPGQSADEDLGLEIEFRIYGNITYTIIEKDLVRIGNMGLGRFVEIDPNGIKLYSNNIALIELDTDGNITVGSGDERIEITAAGIELFSNNVANLHLLSSGDIVVGQGNERINFNTFGIQFYTSDDRVLDLQSGGSIIVGQVATEHIEVSSTAIKFKDGADVYTDLTAGVLKLGPAAAEHLELDGSAIKFKDGATIYTDLTAGVLTLGNNSIEHMTLDSGGLKVYGTDGSTVRMSLQNDLILGPTASDHIKISSAALELKDGAVIRGQWQTDGDIFIGSDISAPATTYLAIFAGAQTYNSESMAAGDMLIGDNSASKANILWDKSAGRLLFRGGQTTKAYIDTDGAITAGAGDVILDDTGLALAAGTGTPNQLNITDGTDTIFKLYSQVDSGTSQLQIVSQGKDSTDHEAYLQLQAITDDGDAHAGAAQCYFTLDTAGDVAIISAEQLRGFKICRPSAITTTQRNALTPVDGMMIYNSTTGKFQGRAGAAWVDFH